MKKHILASLIILTVVATTIAPAFLVRGNFVAPVMNFVAVANNTTSATLSWDIPQFVDAVSLDVRYGDAPITESNFLSAIQLPNAPHPISGMHQSMNVSGLTSATTYYFAIRIIDSTGATSLAKFASIITPNGNGGGDTPPPTPTVPPVMNLTATAVNTTTIKLDWDTPQYATASYFEVVCSVAPITQNSFGNATPVSNPPAPISGAHQTMNVTGLTPSTTYYCGVRIVNTANARSLAAFASATTLSVITPPPTPTVPPVMNLTAVAQNTTTIKLDWDTPQYATASSFEVVYSLNPITNSNFGSATAVSNPPAPISGAHQTMNVTGLTPATLYYFGIRIVSTTNAKSLGAFASATTLSIITPPPTPTVPPVMNLTATAVNTTTIKLDWDTPQYATASYFEVVCSVAPITQNSFGNATPVSNPPAPISGAHQTMNVTGLTPSTTYYCGVRIVNTANARSLAAFASATTQSTGGGGDPIIPPVINISATTSQTYADVSWDTPQYVGLTHFELRYSTTQLTNANFLTGTLATGLPTPVPNTSQGVRIQGLTPATLYYFGIRVFGPGNISSVIVFTSATTLNNGGNPTTSTVPAVINLTATGVNMTVVRLAWDTPQYPTASYFEVVYSLNPITDSNFGTLATLPGAPSPFIGTHQTMDVMGLTPGTLYYFGIRIVNTANIRSPGAFAPAATQTGGGGGGGGGGGAPIGAAYYGAGGSAPSVPSKPTIIINNGAAKTNNQLVTLTISASQCSSMMLSNTSDFASATWEPFATSTRWILFSGNSTKTVYGKCKNTSGTVSDIGTGSIILEVPELAQRVIPTPARIITIASGADALITIAPNLLTVPKGDKLIVVLQAHPYGTAYHARAELSYPVESLTLEKVEYGKGWTPEFGDNINTEDAVRGTMTKSARFPGGFSEPKHFATLTFVSNGLGEGRIDIATTNIHVLPGLSQTTGSDVLGNTTDSKKYLAANILTIVGDANYFAFLTLLSILILIYMLYLGTRDKRRHGKAFVYHGRGFGNR